MSVVIPNLRGAIAVPGWAKNELWRKARAVPSLDLRFADSKSLVDSRTGQNLVTFNRASSGTFVGSDGVVRTATTNLLLRSEEFNDANWGLVSGTVSANVDTSPLGTLTADKLIATNGGPAGQLTQGIVISSGATVTGSVYVKAGGFDRFEIVLLSNNNTVPYGRSTFDPNTGTITTPAFTQNGGTNASSTVQIIGNGWYRFSVTVTYPAVTAAGIRLFISNSDAANGDGVKGVLLWGAQLEQSATVGEYIPTTGTVNSAPRFDHNPITGESLGLLVEEQRTNLLPRSEEFGDPNWVKSQATVTSNSIVSPAGIVSADTIVEDTANAVHVALQNYTFTAAAHTYSIFVKAAGRSFVRLVAFDGTTAFAAYFNLSTGAVGTLTGAVTASSVAYNNAWYRCSITFTSAAGAGNTAIRLATANGTDSYTGNGSSGVYIWGAQLEAGAFPTSYIPTTTAAATRSADVASITGTNFSGWYRQDEGTMFAASSVTSSGYTSGILWDVGAGGAFGATAYTNWNGTAWTLNPNAAPLNILSSVTTSAFAANAAALKANDSIIAANGLIGNLDSSCSVPTSSTTLSIGKGGWSGAANYFNGTIRRLCFWPTRLANETLQSITQ